MWWCSDGVDAGQGLALPPALARASAAPARTCPSPSTYSSEQTLSRCSSQTTNFGPKSSFLRAMSVLNSPAGDATSGGDASMSERHVAIEGAPAPALAARTIAQPQAGAQHPPSGPVCCTLAGSGQLRQLQLHQRAAAAETGQPTAAQASPRLNQLQHGVGAATEQERRKKECAEGVVNALSGTRHRSHSQRMDKPASTAAVGRVPVVEVSIPA